MSSAPKPAAGKPKLTQDETSGSVNNRETQTPASTAGGLASALPKFRNLSLEPKPLLPESGKQVVPFQLNSEVQECEKANNLVYAQQKTGFVVPISAYHCVSFGLLTTDGTIRLLLNHLCSEKPEDNHVTLNIPDDFGKMALQTIDNTSTPLTGTFEKCVKEALIKQTPFGPAMLTSYSVLPENLNRIEYATLIDAFTHSPCLSGVRWMATTTVDALQKHWPKVAIKKILDAGFRMPQHHPFLRNNVFPNIEKIIAVDCQHHQTINNSEVSKKQVLALLHQKDEYVIDFAENYGIPDETDLILIRNLEVHTAPGAWEKFFEKAKAKTSWKALLVSCSSTPIFEDNLKPLIDTHFNSNAFEMIHCGENPEAKRIHVKYSLCNQQVTETIGPDAFSVIIVRKNPSHQTHPQTA